MFGDLRTGCPCSLPQGQADLENRAPVVCGTDRSFVQGCDFLCKGKPDSGAVPAGTEKAVENMRQKLRGNPVSVIADPDDGFSLCLLCIRF